MATVRKESVSRPRKLTPQMEAYISEKMRSEQWSSEQIKGHSDVNGITMVSHETIYKLMRIDTLLLYKADIQTITSDNEAEFARHKEIYEHKRFDKAVRA